MLSRTPSPSLRVAAALLAAVTLIPWVSGCGRSDDDSNTGGDRRPACSFDAEPQGVTAMSLDMIDDEWVTDAGTRLASGLPATFAVAPVDRRSSAGAEHVDFVYAAHGVPLCREPARAHLVAGRVQIEGRLVAASLVGAAWESPTWTFDDPDVVLARAKDEIGASVGTLRAARRCLLVDGGTPRAAFDLEVTLDERPYRVVGSASGLTRLEPRWFEITGEARVYKDNPLSGEMITVPLPDLEDGARLRSKRFVTELAAGFDLAEQDDRRYVYEPTDPRFVEVSVFANAERMAGWFLRPEFGYDMRCTPISIKPHMHFRSRYSNDTNVNNGLYVPPTATASGLPEIQLGNGDGIDLQNLGVDFDPVAHELGHHVLMRRLKSSFGESGILHEGVSDYFVAAATGNTCLGESICPVGGAICAQDGQCLRNADNDLSFEQSDLPLETHVRGQIVSGLLWDLGAAAPGGQDWMAGTVMKSIDYLGESAGLKDFVQGLMAADLELAGGVNACAIYAGAVSRGMRLFLGDLSCTDYVAP